jgi:glycosyltransferase involved in cell wall biosynthesis
MRVLLLAPNIDGTDVGEVFSGFKWAEGLSRAVELTVLTFQRAGRQAIAAQLPQAEVVTWPEPAWLLKKERLNAMLKPAYPLYFAHVRRFLREARAAGRHFDIGHQLLPQAARYPSPLTGTGLPYVIGPLGGTLATPPGFAAETDRAPWFTKLRRLDEFRLRRDPWLRRSYAEAALVLGVAPYIGETLAPIGLRRYENILELGVDNLAPPRPEGVRPDGLRLLHVGRSVRTKGLRDVIRALAQLGDLPGIQLVSAGDGEDLAACRREAEELGVADRVRFEGRVPRERVSELYEEADVFVFPSFREPAGGVLYEAMRAGLPVITVAYGGPNFIVDDTSGLRLALSTPAALADDIAAAVRRLHDDPGLRDRLGRGARARVAAEGLWERKIPRIVALYEEVLADQTPDAVAGAGAGAAKSSR